MSGIVTTLRVSSWLQRSIAHGPGQRFVLWVQGCHLNCPGCFSPSTHDATGGRTMLPRDVIEMVQQTSGVEGITLSGGEPMLQANALAVVATTLRESGYTTMCYSGFTLDELQDSQIPGALQLLESTDILVDGRFRADEQATLRWRGSRNQRVHFLSPAYAHLQDDSETEATQVELVVGNGGYTTTGIWPRGFIRRMERTTQ